MAWAVFDPQTHDPPRWPCRRGESALDPAEPVKRFVEKLGEMKEEVKTLPRFGELEGVLAAEVEKWDKEQVWSVLRKTQVPDWPVNMPAVLWGCPLRGAEMEAAGGEAELGAAASGVAMEGLEPAGGEVFVVRAKEAKEKGAEEVDEAQLREERRKEKKRKHHKSYREKQRVKKREVREEERRIELEIEAKMKEIEELQKQMEKEAPPKKQKKESRGTTGGDAQPAAVSDPQVDSRGPPAGRGSHRGSGRGRGGWRRDHGGLRQTYSNGFDEIARRYRDATPSLANTSFSSSASAPSSLSFIDPSALIAGLGVLGNMAMGRQMPAPVEPVAASSPVASRQQHHQRGRGRGGAYRGRDESRGDRQQQGQRHQRGGGRGAAPPRQ